MHVFNALHENETTPDETGALTDFSRYRAPPFSCYLNGRQFKKIKGLQHKFTPQKTLIECLFRDLRLQRGNRLVTVGNARLNAARPTFVIDHMCQASTGQ